MNRHVVRLLGVALLLALAIGAVSGASGASCGGYFSSCKAKPKLKLKVPKGQSIKSVKADGLKVKATCNQACTVKVSVLAKVTKKKGKGRKVAEVGSKSKSLASGKGTLKIAIDDKALKGRRAKLTLHGVAKSAAGQKSKRAVANVNLKRK